MFTERPRTFWQSVLGLIGHLFGTAVIFVTFIAIGWFIEYVLSALHTIRKFPEEMFGFITAIELGIVYVDALVCAVVLLVGMWRFCKDILGERP
jgi:hypothetical protein